MAHSVLLMCCHFAHPYWTTAYTGPAYGYWPAALLISMLLVNSNWKPVCAHV